MTVPMSGGTQDGGGPRAAGFSPPCLCSAQSVVRATRLLPILAADREGPLSELALGGVYTCLQADGLVGL